MAYLNLELDTFASDNFPQLQCDAGLNFDGSGTPFLYWTNAERELVFQDFYGASFVFELTQYPEYEYPILQRFNDGKWLLLNARSPAFGLNATIFSSDFKQQTQFSVGDAIEQVVIDKKDRIWIGYFDESGGTGLLRYSKDGQLTYDFNQSSEHKIFDLYAMSLDDHGSVWVYPYTEFYLARITNDNVQIALAHSPIRGAHAVSVSNDQAAYFGSYENDSVFVCSLKDGSGAAVALTVGGKKIDDMQVATYGDKIALRADGKNYQFQLQNLIAAASR